MKKQMTRETAAGFAVIALTVLALVLFGLGFSTGYYTYGQMNSVMVTVCYGAALLIECASLVCLKKFPKAVWPRLLTFLVTAALAFGALTLLGDRVEGIGICILTDYDSGHGGEEAIYFSLGSMLAALAAMVFNIIGAFGKDAGEETKLARSRKPALWGACAAVMLAVLIPSLILGGVFKTNAPAAGKTTVQAADGSSVAGTYKTTISGAETNLDILQDEQFQLGKLQGLMNVDSRLTLDLALTLNADGTYALTSDAYCVEAGKRAVIGDDTGLGMISVMKAEGTYAVNEDGTVTTSKASHANFQLELDTYSSQMRSPAKYQLGDAEAADGTYDSAEYPAVLDAVPSAVWTVADGKISAYKKNTDVTGTHTVTISGAESNLDILQDEQFQLGKLQGLMNVDSRLTLDLALTLNADGTYALTSDAYCVEAGKRAVIGDDTGLGMISIMKAEGTYTVNEDGTVTTSAAEHANFQLELDTYSSQMRSPAKYQLGDAEAADGTYDSAEYPAVLDAVPSTIWTVADGKITAYEKNTDVTGTYTVTISGAEVNLDILQDQQFQLGKLHGLMNVDSRLTLDLALTLNADGTYALTSDAYCVEAGKRAVIGDDTGLGMISIMKAEGTYTVNEDGTVTTSPAEHANFQLALDTYSSQMRSPAHYQLGDAEAADGTYDSAEHPAVLDAVPETVWTLSGSSIAGYQVVAPEEEAVEEPAATEAPAEPVAASAVITSDDGGTTMTLSADGTYQFDFAAYSISEKGTYTYEKGILTLTDKNGKTSVGEGDPIKLHYTYSDSDQLTGDYTIPADTLNFASAEAAPVAEAPAAEPVVIASDDGGTEMTFNADGTYRFWFEAYSIEDVGTYAYENGVLTLTDKNGKASVGEGDPIKLHYAYSDSDQLTGDYTIPAEALTFGAAAPVTEAPAAEAPAAEPVVIASDDGGTEMTFNADGTYRFWFEAYSIEDLGTYTYENGVLTLTDKNGKASVGEGDPIKLHYAYSDSDQLTGDYTIPAEALTFGAAAAPAEEAPATEAPAVEAPAAEPVVIASDDGGTEMTFNADGTYRFWFEAYSIEDLGTYTYENGVLTLTDKNGKASVGEGDPIKLHYAYSDSDQLTGDYTIPAEALSFGTAAAPAAETPVEAAPVAEAPAAEPVVIASDDGGTEMTFNADGTYRFWFEAYSIEDLGTYTYENGVLTLTDKNGKTSVGEGDPIKLHYAYSDSDQLTGDYTIPAEALSFGTAAAPAVETPVEAAPAEEIVATEAPVEEVPATEAPAEEVPATEAPVEEAPVTEAPVEEVAATEAPAAEVPAAEPVVIPSDDAGTEMTFNPDGTYRFWFEAYSIEDLGTYTYENGVLTLTDKNGKTSVGEGDPIKLHYTYSGSDQLTGDYTIPAEALSFGTAAKETVEAPAAEPIVIPSDDGGTEMTFNADGTYRFWFEAYSIEDLGTYTYENGVLTLTDKNGKTSVGEGDPIKLHYTYSGSDQLTGDYTIPADSWSKSESGENKEAAPTLNGAE